MPLAWLWASKVYLIEILNIENNLGVVSFPQLKPRAQTTFVIIHIVVNIQLNLRENNMSKKDLIPSGFPLSY